MKKLELIFKNMRISKKHVSMSEVVLSAGLFFLPPNGLQVT